MKKLCILLVLSQFFFINTNAQNLDSLEKVIVKEGIKTSDKLKIYDDLSWGYLSSDFKKASFYANKGIELAQKVNDPLMEGTLYRNLGITYYMFSKFDSASMFYEKAMQCAISANNLNLQALINSAIGNLYNMKGEYQTALKYYLKALPVFEKLGNKQRIRILLGNTGTLYLGLNNFAQAEKYFLKSKKIAEEINDLEGLGQAYEGLCRIYIDKEQYGKAIEYGKQAIETFHSTGNKLFEANSMQSLAMAYYNGPKDYDKAEMLALKALDINNEIGLPGHIAGALNMLSNIAFHKKQYEKCKQYAIKGFNTDSTDSNINSNLMANLVRSGIWLGDKKMANEYFDKYRDIIDIRGTKEFQNTLTEMEVKYETEKKQIKIEALEKEKKLFLLLTISGASVLILLITALFLVYKNIKNQKRIVEEEMKNLEQKQKLVATQAVLDGETAERSRLAKDLHDSLGGMLAVVKLNLQDAKKLTVLDSGEVNSFNKALDLLDNSIKELRRVAHHMMPESLMRYGLKVALSDFCESISVAKFQHFGLDSRIENKLEVLLYRSAHELVHNALKHAEATQINVQLIQESDRISLTVHDNGKGFDAKKEFMGMGLKNIKQRVEIYNGIIDVYSEKNKGTEVNLSFQLNPENNAY